MKESKIDFDPLIEEAISSIQIIDLKEVKSDLLQSF